MSRIPYGTVCENTLSALSAAGVRKKLLLHVCCAPCASYVIEYLEKYFDITLFFYNPNITDPEEFNYRLSELQRFVNEREGENFKIIVPPHNPESFFEMCDGLESEPEGGARCHRCYRQRLRATADEADRGGFDFFTTTLSVSPYKNADKLNYIGMDLENGYDVKYLISDFKKKNGYLRSIELSSIHNLYRQDYCGCVYSAREAEARKVARNNRT